MNKDKVQALSLKYKIRHSISLEARYHLYDLASKCKSPIIEIGSKLGSSIIFLAHGSYSSKNNIKVYSIDNRKKNKFDSILSYHTNIKKMKCEEIISLNCLHEDAVDFFSCPIGLLFIDVGGMTQENFNYWLSLVINDGLICIKDWPKTNRSLNDFIKKKNLVFYCLV